MILPFELQCSDFPGHADKSILATYIFQDGEYKLQATGSQKKVGAEGRIMTTRSSPAFFGRKFFTEPQCSHLRMTRLYDEEILCVSCQLPGPCGWLYKCTQDREDMIEAAVARGEAVCAVWDCRGHGVPLLTLSFKLVLGDFR
jgi:hypothetical protein